MHRLVSQTHSGATVSVDPAVANVADGFKPAETIRSMPLFPFLELPALFRYSGWDTPCQLDWYLHRQNPARPGIGRIRHRLRSNRNRVCSDQLHRGNATSTPDVANPDPALFCGCRSGDSTGSAQVRSVETGAVATTVSTRPYVFASSAESQKSRSMSCKISASVFPVWNA